MSENAWEDYQVHEEEQDAPRLKKSGFPLPVFIALAAMGGFVWLSWYAYQVGTGGGHSEVRVMKAPEEEYKAKPAHPGGMKVPHQDKEVLHATADSEEALPKVEALLPKEEEPIALHEQVKDADKDKLMAAREAHFSGEEVSESLKASAHGIEEKPTKLVPTESYPEIMDIRKSPAKPVESVMVKPAPLMVKVPAKTSNAAAPKLKPVVRSVSSKATTSMPGYRLQLGSFRSRKEVDDAWAKLSKAHKDLLGGVKYISERTVIDGRGVFFRLHAGPFGDKAEPRQLCKNLQERSQACFVVKRDK